MGTDDQHMRRHENREGRDLLIGGGSGGGGGGGIGNTWEFPKLSTLKLWNSTDIPFRMNPNFLARCPQLEHVILEDARRMYKQGEIVYGSPAVLLSLKHLCLVGTPAISFHPETLRNTPKLVCLELNMKKPLFALDNEAPAQSYFDAITAAADSVGEVPNTITSTHQHQYGNHHHFAKPIWAWDWHLPCLTTLRLCGEFAYDFQFRMLDRTPNIGTLNLDTGHPEMFHRIVGDTDFLKPGTRRVYDVGLEVVLKGGYDHSQEEEKEREKEDEFWLGLEYLHVPALKSLTISAPWTIGGSSTAGVVDHSSGRRTLKILFSKVAPNLEWIILRGEVDGFKFEDWVDLTSRYLLCLKYASTMYKGREEDLGKYGLMKMPGAKQEWSYCMVVQPEGRDVGLPPADYFVKW